MIVGVLLVGLAILAAGCMGAAWRYLRIQGMLDQSPLANHQSQRFDYSADKRDNVA